MSRFSVLITRGAAQSIGEQARFYRDQWLVGRWQSSVNDAIASLQYSPERGKLCSFAAPQLLGLRRIPILGFSRHLIFYQVFPAPMEVRIVDVVDGRRDLTRMFGAKLPR